MLWCSQIARPNPPLPKSGTKCPDPVEDLCMKQFWSFFPDEFLENFTEVRSMFETFSVNAYVHMLESQKAWDKDESTSPVPK